MVVVPKKTGQLCICVDLKPISESVIRELHPYPTVDETLGQLTEAAVFSNADANSGFWQISLHRESRLLTTFITPFGRYCFNKLPFRICTAPEHFQKQMSNILYGLIDNVLKFGKDQREHDTRLYTVLRILEKAGVTLNPVKSVFSRRNVKFLGHLIDRDSIRPDPEKIAAIVKMQALTNISELTHFVDMINQFANFTHKITELTQTLRSVLRKRNYWIGARIRGLFQVVKEELVKPLILALYNPVAPTNILADASSFGFGAVICQRMSQLTPGTHSVCIPIYV